MSKRTSLILCAAAATLSMTSLAPSQRRADVRLVGGNVEARIVEPNGVDHYFVFRGVGIGGVVEVPATLAACASPVVFTIGPANAHNHAHTIDWLDCDNTRHRWSLPVPVSSRWLAGSALPVSSRYGFGCGMQSSLELDIDAEPALGTTRTLSATGVPATTTAIGVWLAFDPARPEYPLTVLGLNAPECYVFVDLASAMPVGVLTSPGPAAAFPLPLPNSTALSGLVTHAQAFALSPGENPAGVVSSNGLHLVLAR